MTLATPDITVYFGLPQTGGDFFTLDDPVKGLLDNVTYLLAGDVATAVDVDGYEVRVRRGRNRELDEFETGTAEVRLHNHSRTYDDTNAASPLFGEVTPGKRVNVTVWGQTIFDGIIEDWNNDWSVDGDAAATFLAVDALGELALREFDEWTTTAAQTAGPRLTASLNRAEVNFGINRDFDTGASVLQADLVTWGSNVLNYCQLVAKSDAGRFFATRTNVLRFMDRHGLVNPMSTVDFRDDGTGIPFHGITTQVGAELLFNRVGVDREGGTLQTSEDADSQDEYGVRALNMSGLLMNSDEQSSDMADHLLALYRQPETRVASIMVKLLRLDGDDRGAVTQLDIGDVIAVSWTPQGVGAALEQSLVVEGVEHQLDRSGIHVMWLHTSPAQQFGVFILDDPVWGLLDAGNRLGY
jgi:hypothetical protein